MRKRSSDHKLERMGNVSSIDLYSAEIPTPGGVHYPIQREFSDADRRIVPGKLGTSITRRTQDFPDDEDRIQEEATGATGATKVSNGSQSEGAVQRVSNGHKPSGSDLENGVLYRAEGAVQSVSNGHKPSGSDVENGVLYEDLPEGPIQRVSSISCESKLLLSRISIGLEQYDNIRRVQERFLKESIAKSNRSSRQSYDMSEVSTPPSLSPNNSSQFSSLGDSGTDVSSKADHAPDHAPMSLFSGDALPPSTGTQLPSFEHTSSFSDNTLLSDYTYSDHTPSLSTLSTLKGSSGNYSSSLSSSHTPTSHYPAHDHDFKSHDPALMSHDHDFKSHDPALVSHDHSQKSHDSSISSSSVNTVYEEALDNHRHFKGDEVKGDGVKGDESNSMDEGSDNVALDLHIFATKDHPDSGSHAHHSEGHTHQDSRTDSEYSTDTNMTSADLPASAVSASPFVVSKNEMVDIYALIDQVRERHRDDIARMKNRGHLITQLSPELTPDLEEKRRALMQQDAPEPEAVHDMLTQPPSMFPHMERELYRRMMEPVDELVASEEDVNHREHLREYLIGQFQRHQVYREGTHWQRQTKLGKGGQATCYSILDSATNLSLALKEAAENGKSLDEAYICLKLANERNVSRNIAEYFGAAMLPSHHHNTVQLFMEIMPTSMQDYLFRNGPLSVEDVHHFSFQLFDALEYLHNKERIIHCDVKPANLLLDYTAQRVKLADFGAAELLEEKRKVSDSIHGDVGAGTLAYNPPEHYSHSDCSFALDSWQAGCCVLAMCTGRRPWRHLFMDPVLQSPGNRQLFNQAKKDYGKMIGKQRDGHMIPAFLDVTIEKLLYGCLHSDPKLRLTAVESWQLLAYAEDMNEEQRRMVTDVIGYSSSTPLILKSYSAQTQVDVFIGSSYDSCTVNDLCHALSPGWVGAVPYHQHMTYKDLCQEIFSQAFPVLQHLGPVDVTTWSGTPQELFVATSPAICQSAPSQHLFTPVDRGLKVDPAKAVVLFKQPRPLSRKTSY